MIPVIPLAIAYKQYHALPPDMRQAVDRILVGRKTHTQQQKRNMLNDAIDTVKRAIECENDCCALLTREERLSDRYLLED